MHLYLTALLIYSIFLMALGVIIGRRVRNSSEFLVAGRSLSAGRLFATLLAANIGAASTVGATGLGYRFGLSAWWWVGSAAIGSFLLSRLLGPRLWRLAKQHGFATLQDYLEFRYDKRVKALISVLFWCGSLTILAGQIIAISWILEAIAGIPKWEGCVIGGLVAIVYCTAGGLMASSFVNMFELAVTMSGLLLAVPFTLHAVGGWTALHAHLAPQASSINLFSITGAGWRQILAWIAILVPSFMISPGLVQKVYGARDERAVRLGVGFNALGQAVFAFVPPILGLCALAALPHLANPEQALPSAIQQLLPKWLGVWILASIFSAELSATDAILLMLSTSLAVDLYKTFVNPGVSSRRLLFVSRTTSILAGVAGILLAIVLPSVIAAVSIFYSLLAVALLAPVVAGLYMRRVLAPAALASIAVSVAVTVTVRYLTQGAGFGILSPPAAGIAAAFIVMLGFRILNPRAISTPGETDAA
ncbi:MAG: sodium:solute symporter family protein [Acidobacteriaceae bacterium]|nr:sodium:solute symporter family protein [Acidobacteriaceae bacterium]